MARRTGYAIDVVFSTAGPTNSTTSTTAATIWSSSLAPAAVNQNVYDPGIVSNGGVDLGTKFISSVAGLVTGVQFWKGGGASGVQVGELWNSSGQLLAAVNFSSESGTGWQTATFSTPVSIAAGTTYVISYHTTSPLIAYSPYAFASGGVTKAR